MSRLSWSVKMLASMWKFVKLCPIHGNRTDPTICICTSNHKQLWKLSENVLPNSISSLIIHSPELRLSFANPHNPDLSQLSKNKDPLGFFFLQETVMLWKISGLVIQRPTLTLRDKFESPESNWEI